MLRIKQAEAKDEGERASKAVGKKMLGLAGATAEVAGRAEVSKASGDAGVAGGQTGGQAGLRGLDLFWKAGGAPREFGTGAVMRLELCFRKKMLEG